MANRKSEEFERGKLDTIVEFDRALSDEEILELSLIAGPSPRKVAQRAAELARTNYRAVIP